MDYEVYPRVGLGPFRLGMTQEEAEKLRNRLGLPKPPDSFYLEYEEGCLSRIGLNTSENIRILYRGQDRLPHPCGGCDCRPVKGVRLCVRLCRS